MTLSRFRWLAAALTLTLVAALGLAACGDSDTGDAGSLTVYSGREEEIVAPLLAAFEEETGITLDIRYGSSSELAAQIAEEGENTPADVFFSQDAGALGAISSQLTALSQAQLDRVPEAFRAPDGLWVGTSGRARVVAYNTEAYSEGDLPDTIDGYLDPKFKGKLGIAPTNASFQAFVTVMRLERGDEKTKEFLNALKANDAQTYEKNGAIVEAIARGEIDLGLVNHYYVGLLKNEQPDAPVANRFLAAGDPGSFVNIAGIGVLGAGDQVTAGKLVDYLLSDEGQAFYATESAEPEYPLVAGAPAPEGLPALSTLQGANPVSFADLGAEAKNTLELLNEVGLTS
jgi:iron(III) transport system substrate-binding protein